jgi:hypothetical protein
MLCLPTMIFIKQSGVSKNQLQNETAVNNLNVIKHKVIIRTAKKIERFSAVNVNTNVLTKRTLKNQSSRRTPIITL